MRPASLPSSHPLWRDGIDSLSLPTLTTDHSCDVAIIGGGFSGLWSAFHLLNFDPSLSIAIFEGEEIGFGASGRNGGWVSADYPVDQGTLTRRYPDRDIKGFSDLLARGVDEIGEIASKISPRSHFRKAGSLLFATNQIQLRRLQDSIDERHHLLSARELEEKITLPSAIGALFTKDCGTVNPRGLLLDLAIHLKSRGVSIFERSLATRSARGLRVNGHPVRAAWTIEATEAFRRRSREQIPLYSLMIATRALSAAEKKSLGWTPGLAIAEATNNVNYAQLTSDARLAVGGRGARYPFGSQLDPSLESASKTHQELTLMIHSWFSLLDQIEITHHWGGAIAIRRNWESRISIDQRDGFAQLGGYVGDGMTMSFISARAVAAEITKGEKLLASMPIDSTRRGRKKWPIEPLRYLGANALFSNIRALDRAESEGKKSRWRRKMMALIGK